MTNALLFAILSFEVTVSFDDCLKYFFYALFSSGQLIEDREHLIYVKLLHKVRVRVRNFSSRTTIVTYSHYKGLNAEKGMSSAFRSTSQTIKFVVNFPTNVLVACAAEMFKVVWIDVFSM